MNQDKLQENIKLMITEILSVSSDKFTGKLIFELNMKDGGVGSISSYKAKLLKQIIK